MRILKRYILGLFLRPFLWSLSAFVGILFLADLFQLLKTILKNKIPFTASASYFLNYIPYITVQVTPIAVLLGTIFCLNQITKSRELTIMKATGLSVKRIITPLLHASLVISLMVLLLNEFVVPQTIHRANYLKWNIIEKTELQTDYEDISFNFGNRFFYIQKYNVPTGKMEKIQIIDRRLDEFRTISARIDAASGTYKKQDTGGYEWILNDVIIRNFNDKGELDDMQRSTQTKLLLQYSPQDFKKTKGPDEMNIAGLMRYFNSSRESGNYDPAITVDLFNKIAFPLASFFIAFLGIPFALRSKRSGAATGFGMSIIISFVYWTAMSLCLAWGKDRLMPSYIAAFLPNMICFILAMYMMQKTPS